MELPEKKLSDAELDIMLAIWQSPPPVQRADLEEQLRSHNWAIPPCSPCFPSWWKRAIFRWSGRAGTTCTVP